MTDLLYRADIVHELTCVNLEKRAGRTRCGRYLEFWANELLEGEGRATCLECLATPLPELTPGHVLSDDAVHERGDDIARHCGAKHMSTLDRDGRCARCGYGQRGATFQ